MKYDPFQQKAIDYINQGHSVIVAAPTGAGKTVIAEHIIRQCLERNEKVIYTAPIKALSNQKYRDFSENFPEKVGILTGDVSINSHAPTLIMTTEIFRNKILEAHSSLADYSWIIFDEIHYLDDWERGAVWEESLMFLPEHMRVLGLSATVPNVDELAGWLESIHQRPVKVVKEGRRPVPLHFFFQCQNRLYDKLPQLAKQGYKPPDGSPTKGGKIPRFVPIHHNRMGSLVKHLIDEELLPCIYFVFSRRRTELLAEEISQYVFLDAGERRQISLLFDELCDRFDVVADPGTARIRPFIEKGIAYHHAGMLPTLKEIIERLFTSRLIKMIFTTETFALGINMPARTVVFDELRKFYGRTHETLRTRDFYQMAGRAGRRSIDTEGFVFCRINPHFIAPFEIQRVIYSEPEEVRSRFDAAYATILNLYQKYGEKLYDIYPLSFHYYQENKRWRKRALEALRAKVRILKDLGYIRKQKITPKGLFAGRVYGYELLLSELYIDGTLENLTEKELGILVMALVYEPRKGSQKPALDKPAKRLEKMTKSLIRNIHRMEKKARLRSFSKKCFFHLSPVVEAWIRGEDFGAVLALTDADEGEVVRYLRMTIQVLRDIAEAPVTEQLQERIWRLIQSINRDVVDAEKQLRG